ncbi:MAG: zinc-ribbon domain-containing protein [Gemmatimonadetes bacterium]|nr:zinc-ribbon domain-containing protein [Gemmatimonadota bacterium]
MNVHCPTCETVYRVDPAKVPAGGVSARCARCSHVFRVESPTAGATKVERPGAEERPPAAQPAAAVAEPPPAPAATPPTPPVAPPRAGPLPTPPPAPAVRPRPETPTPKPPATPPPPPVSRETAPDRTPKPAAPAPEPAEAARSAHRPFAFGRRDPNERAQRLARALVSDIVTYYPDRRDRALNAGNLRTEFREEIRKSWEEYVAQVGEELAKKTPYFRAALNEILADGQQLF